MTLSLPPELIPKVHRYFSCIQFNHRPISFTHTPHTSTVSALYTTLSIICGGKSTIALLANGRRQNSHPKYTTEERCENFSNIQNSYTNYPHGEMVRLTCARCPSYIPSTIQPENTYKSDAFRFPFTVYVYIDQGWGFFWVDNTILKMHVCALYIAKSDHIHKDQKELDVYIRYTFTFHVLCIRGTDACESAGIRIPINLNVLLSDMRRVAFFCLQVLCFCHVLSHV